MKQPPKLIISSNPLDASDFQSFLLSALCSVQEVVASHQQRIPTHLPYITFLNEKPILKNNYDKTILQHEDVLTIATLPQKEIVASALTIFAIAASGPLGVGLGSSLFGAGSVGAGLVASAFSASLVGLIGSAVWAGASASPQLGIEPKSPSYSLYAATNRVRNGQAIPAIYGKHRVVPDIIAPAYSRFEENGQALYQLFAIGYGKFDVESAALGNIKLHEKNAFKVIEPNSTLPKATGNWHATLGDVRNYSLSYKDDWSDPISIGKDQFAIGTIEIDLFFPSGIFKTSGTASSQGEIHVAIEYRTIGSKDWKTIPDKFIKSGGIPESTKTLSVTKKKILKEDNELNVLAFSGNNINAFGYSIQWAVPSGVYEVRTRNLSQSTISSPAYVVWASLKGFLISPPSRYSEISLLPLRLVASAATSGQANQRISLIVKRKIKIYNPTSKTWSNPTFTNSIPFAIADMLKNTTYGAGLQDDQIDLEALYQLDSDLPAHYTFNAIFDQSITLWEAVKRAGRCAQIDPYIQGGKIRFSRDVIENYPPPTTLFGPHNIIKNSFKILYRMDDFETPSQLSVEFINPEKNWTSDTKTIQDAQHYQQPLHTRIQLFGCTNQKHAEDEGRSILRKTLKRRRVVSFETELDGMLPLFGDTIAITHPLPSWGSAGVIEHYNPQSNSIRISEKIDHNGYIVIRFNDGSLSKIIEVSPTSSQELKLIKEIISPSKETTVLPDFSEKLSSLTNAEPTLFAFGKEVSNWSQNARVIAIRPKNRHIVTVEAIVLT